MFTRVLATTAVLALGTAFVTYADDAPSSKQSADHKQIKTAEDVANKLNMLNHKEIECGKLGQRKAENAEVKEFARMLEADHTRANEQVQQFAAAKNIKLKAHDDAHGNHSSRQGEPGDPGSVGTPGTKGTPGNEREIEDRDGANSTSDDSTSTPSAVDDQNSAQGKPGDPGSVGTPGTKGTPGNERDVESNGAGDGDSSEKAEAADHKNADSKRADEEGMRRLESLSGEEFDREYITMMAHAHGKAIHRLTAAKEEVEDAEAKELIASMLPDLQKHKDQATALSQKLGGNPEESQEADKQSAR